MENRLIDKKKDGLIMVVDDDSQVLALTSLLLSKYGYQTISFDNRVIVSEVEKLDTIVQKFQSLLNDKRSLFVNEDINTVMQSALSVTRNEAADKGLELVVALSEYPLKINMEKDLMKVAICHVVRNAIASPPGRGMVKVQS